MGFDASGTFTRYGGATIWMGDATSGTKILAGRHDSHDQEIANGLSECLTRSGKGVPTTDIPWGGKKITNLASPTQPQDAATKQYVDTLPGWDSYKNLGGADLAGRLNFTSTSGVNGITWTYADVSWVARHSEPSKTLNRLAMNNSVAPNTTGEAIGDVFIIDDTGRVNNSGHLTQNLSYDGALWRTISPGTGTKLQYIDGAFSVSSNYTATITNTYAVATQRDFFVAASSDGNMTVGLYKDVVKKTVDINAYTGTSLRWKMALGDATDETATRKGSNFSLKGYANAGDAPVEEIRIDRETHEITVGGAITGPTAMIIAPAPPDRTVTPAVALNGTIHLRPDGIAFPAAGTVITAGGSVQVCQGVNGTTGATGGVYAGAGLRGKASGYQGSYDSYWHNFYYSGGFEYVYINATLLGAITWQSDYRIKRNIEPLPSMWEKVKSLNPIRYNHRRYLEFVQDDEVERWGMFAHELQEKLVDSAAIGHKDEDNVIQSVNPLTVIAALTKALQEAMLRIEALESAA